MAYTNAGILIAPPVANGSITNGSTIDLEPNGTNDIHFLAGNVHAFDAQGSWTGLDMLQSGLEVAVDMPGGYVAKRLDLLDPVDASLTWRAYEDGGPNSLTLASLLTNFAGQWDTTGAGQWFVDNATATQGYMGVRMVVGNDTLYGWVNLASYVSQDSSALWIDNFAIETGTTGIADAPGSNAITAVLTPDGVLIQVHAVELMNITLRDLSGRLVRQVTRPSPYLLDITDKAHGIYALTVTEGTRVRSFKLAW